MHELVIAKRGDYADEFDYPIFSLFSEEERAEALVAIARFEEDGNDEYAFWFGSNEAYEISPKEVRKMIQNAEPLKEAHRAGVLWMKKQIPHIDLLERVMET